MYTNIDTSTGIAAVSDFLHSNRANISTDFPIDLFLQILRVVMQNNIFTFANSYWLQTTGTAMGTPVACTYATITFGHFENTVLLSTFKWHLLFFKRYIDDIIGIWIPPNDNDPGPWDYFKTKLNEWGNLRWKIEEPSKRTVFLDLEIQLENTTITTKTYQKDMNLYLYIPPSSAHPPSCFKGLITGELRRYWTQNNPKDYQTILHKFIERLTERGHTIEAIEPILHQAALSISAPRITTTKDKKSDENTLYIHRVFHPNGLQRTDIRRLYKQILEPVLPYDKMIVAMARPSNLRDVLTKTALTLPAGLDIYSLIHELNQAQTKSAQKAIQCQKPN
jgi:hypothetical protein